MIKNIRFDLFKEHMKIKTEFFLQEYESFDEYNAISLDIYNDIVFHLELVGIHKDNNIKKRKTSIDYYNLAYKAIETLYINHLKLQK